MNKHWEVFIILTFTAISGIMGASISKAMKLHVPWATFWYYGVGFLSITSWIWMTKRSPYNLLVTSLVWDVVYVGAWTMTTIWMGEAASHWQIGGAVLIFLGLMLLNF